MLTVSLTKRTVPSPKAKLTPATCRDLKPVAPDAASILQRNVYGWFERVERGVYRLTEPGEMALQRWI